MQLSRHFELRKVNAAKMMDELVDDVQRFHRCSSYGGRQQRKPVSRVSNSPLASRRKVKSPIPVDSGRIPPRHAVTVPHRAAFTNLKVQFVENSNLLSTYVIKDARPSATAELQNKQLTKPPWK